MTQLAIKWPFSFPPRLTSHFCTTWEKQNRQNMHQNQQKKLYKILFFPDMWPPTANQLQGLTAVQQQVY